MPHLAKNGPAFSRCGLGFCSAAQNIEELLVNLLILGRGKTGSLVAEVARERGHDITLLCSAENPHASALTAEKLRDVDVVIDFTTPQAVLENIEACVGAGTNMVVGTTGWYGDLEKVRQLVEKSGSGFLYGANFSIGINLLFEAARTAAGILQHQYSGQIFERHHEHKKDAPSGTAVTFAKDYSRCLRQGAGNHFVPRRAMWLGCTRSCWIRPTTLFTFATIPSRAGDSPRGRCGLRSGWLGKRDFLILRIFGERPKEPSFARAGRGRAPLPGSCQSEGRLQFRPHPH